MLMIFESIGNPLPMNKRWNGGTSSPLAASRLAGLGNLGHCLKLVWLCDWFLPVERERRRGERRGGGGFLYPIIMKVNIHYKFKICVPFFYGYFFLFFYHPCLCGEFMLFFFVAYMGNH